MAAPINSNVPAPEGDLIARGNYKRSALGTLIFIGLRMTEVPLSYLILRPGGLGESFAAKLGLSVVSDGGAFQSGLPFIDSLSLPLPRLLLLLVSAAGVAKSVLWASFLSRERMPPKNALILGIAQPLSCAFPALFYFPTAASVWSMGLPKVSIAGADTPVPVTTIIGPALFLLAVYIEWAAEFERRTFKDKEGNDDKLYTEGLWSWVRHPNYGAFIVQRGLARLVTYNAEPELHDQKQAKSSGIEGIASKRVTPLRGTQEAEVAYLLSFQ
ncbi:hypothetical protein GQ53DRAFT_800731 [Thozetella sp. PMI_491]|nr:hypothetical protein GQ53DRAFT_800731 [Thozetella sp. PMI_491]